MLVIARAAAIGVALSALASPVAAGDGPRYILTDLGPSANFERPSINNIGQVTFNNREQAVIWSAGVVTPVSFGGGGLTLHMPLSINSLGDVAGLRGGSAGANIAGAPVNLDWVGGIISGRAESINDSRLVVVNKQERSWVYDHGTGTATEVLGDRVAGYSINNLGEVVGSNRPPSAPGRAFRWHNGTMTILHPTQAAANVASGANAVNDAGYVVGSFGLSGPGTSTQVFLAAPDNATVALPRHPASDINYALALNEQNVIVGYARRLAGGYRAMVWENGELLTLTEEMGLPDWTFEIASGINDSGQIVGLASYNGHPRAFLLTPVPGPGAGVLMIIPAWLCGTRRRRD